MEHWKNGTRYVERYPNGRLKSVLTVQQEGLEYVGKRRGKIIYREPFVIRDETPQDEDKTLYRTSYVLNNIPVSGSMADKFQAVKNSRNSWNTGFRIVAFSYDRDLLDELRENLKNRLIAYIESQLGYNESEFWFDYYWGYEAPYPVNGSKSDNGVYYCWIESPKGYQLHQVRGSLDEL